MKTTWDKIFDPHTNAPLTSEEEALSLEELLLAYRENEALLSAPEHQRVVDIIEEQLLREECME